MTYHKWYANFPLTNYLHNIHKVSSAVQAIHCRLSEVIPLEGENWSDACTNRLISLAHQKLVTIVATGTVYACVHELHFYLFLQIE